MNKRIVSVTFTYVVDDDGANLLPGWPGSTSPDDPNEVDAPMSGLELALERAGCVAAQAIETELPAVLGAGYCGHSVDVTGEVFDDSSEPI